MFRLIQLLIFGHVHEWETITTARLQGEFGGLGTRYHLRCKECGAVKKKDLI